jgi:hypothetical protein
VGDRVWVGEGVGGTPTEGFGIYLDKIKTAAIARTIKIKMRIGAKPR